MSSLPPARVFITGVGVVSSLGLGKRAFFDALAAGTSGISPVEAFDATKLGRAFALKGPRVAVVIGTTMGEAGVLGDLDHAWIHKGAGAVRRASSLAAARCRAP